MPVTETALFALTQASSLQGSANNLVPAGKRLPDFLALVRMHSAPVLKRHGLNNRHDLRAAFACEQYQRITGQPAPVISGCQPGDKDKDTKARQLIAELLGHNRMDVVAAYLGGRRQNRSFALKKV